MKKHRTLIVALALLATSAPAALAGGTSSGALSLNAQVASAYTFVARQLCPPGTPETTRECVRFVSATGSIPGLGRSTITYVKYFDDTICPNQVTQPRTVTVDIAGKGQIDVAMQYPVCSNYAPSSVVLNGIISAGTGVFAGASGSVRLASTVYGPQCGSGGCTGSSSDTWTGNLSVPGLEFDVTPPILQGVRPKSVKAPRNAKSVRVRYSVTAQDDTGASMPSTCLPRSGSRFEVGRTNVKCTAEDSSANVATASFMVTVKKARR